MEEREEALVLISFSRMLAFPPRNRFFTCLPLRLSLQDEAAGQRLNVCANRYAGKQEHLVMGEERDDCLKGGFDEVVSVCTGCAVKINNFLKG